MATQPTIAAPAGELQKKPRLSVAQIFNMSFGFLGIQFGFALQNSNASGILRNYGADVEHLSWFWIAAPLIGMIVQPIVGHYSDKTWSRLGRRKPYFLAGAILSASALVLMPNANILGSIAPLRAWFMREGLQPGSGFSWVFSALREQVRR